MTAAAVLLSPLALLVLYAIGVQAERGGVWRVLLPVAWVCLVLDVALNFTAFAVLLLDFPLAGEWTLSQRLTRLNKRTDWRGTVARWITRILDRLDPSGQHVKP